MDSLGEILKRRRDALGLTQRGLAEQVGVSHTYIYALESGRNDIPSPKVMAPLARAINVSEAHLLQAVGYMQDDAEAASRGLLPNELSGENLFEALVRQFKGDRNAAAQLVYEALGIAIHRRR